MKEVKLDPLYGCGIMTNLGKQKYNDAESMGSPDGFFNSAVTNGRGAEIAGLTLYPE
jgi:hypothetical protein